MKLWILSIKDNLPVDDNPWKPWYDKCTSIVVRAEFERDAREVASRDSEGEEKEDSWLLSKYSDCVELTQDGEPGVIINDVSWA